MSVDQRQQRPQAQERAWPHQQTLTDPCRPLQTAGLLQTHELGGPGPASLDCSPDSWTKSVLLSEASTRWGVAVTHNGSLIDQAKLPNIVGFQQVSLPSLFSTRSCKKNQSQMFQCIAHNSMGKQLQVCRVWNLRVDEGPQIFRKLTSQELEEVGMKPHIWAETL